MKILVKSVGGDEVILSSVSELALGDSVDSACAFLSVSFFTEKPLGEVVSVKAFNGEKLIFNGFCDCQKRRKSDIGYDCYIYARSSACLLLDNEAKPFTYNRTSASLLYEIYARELGFKNLLPDISCDALYEVQKGSSLFGAINQFVSLLTGERIYVNADNEITVLKRGGSLDADSLDVISAIYVINRSEPISSIRFKRDASEPEYSRRAHAVISDGLCIDRTRYINLGTLPKWQREYTVLKQLKASYEKYKSLELTVCGYLDPALFTNVKYTLDGERLDDFYLCEKRYTADGKGERTKLVLRKKTDVKENTYVD